MKKDYANNSKNLLVIAGGILQFSNYSVTFYVLNPSGFIYNTALIYHFNKHVVFLKYNIFNLMKFIKAKSK